MSEWKDISSAPVNTGVLVYFDRIGMGYNVMSKNERGEWREIVDDGRALKDGYAPAFWMPLPPPPKGGE